MLKGMVSLVTGGAAGFGKATVERLVQQGGKVVIIDNQGGRLQDLAKRLGDDVIPYVGDVTSDENVREAVELVKTNFGKLDMLVNCAGWAEAVQTYNFVKLKSCQEQFFLNCLNVNTIGLMNVIRLSVGLMAKNKPSKDDHRGLIVNTTCTIPFEADIGQVAIAASHGAAIGMTRPLSWDLAPQGIRVVAIAPGLFDSQLLSDKPPEVIEYLENTIPFHRRFGKAAEYAKLVTSIVENPMINGSVIKFDAGFRMFPLTYIKDSDQEDYEAKTLRKAKQKKMLNK